MYKTTFAIALSCFFYFAAIAQTSTAPNDQPYIIENYYRVKWGRQQEFIDLYKKNHYPIVKKMKELGYITEIIAEKPHFHSAEADRWDYRVRLVFKNLDAAFEEEDWTAVSKELYPDQKTLEEEEKKRFELLIAHWDVLIVPVELED